VPASLGPGLRTVNGAVRSLGAKLSSRASKSHDLRIRQQSENDARRCDCRGYGCREVGVEQRGAGTDRLPLVRRARSPTETTGHSWHGGRRGSIKKRPSNRSPLSLCIRLCQFSALHPSRSNIPASSAEIDAFPWRNSRPVHSTGLIVVHHHEAADCHREDSRMHLEAALEPLLAVAGDPGVTCPRS
jgi:hypothetical protein